MLKTILLLCLSLALSSAQLLQNGQCDPNIQVQSDFRVRDFLGRWFVVRRSETNLSRTDCSYIDLTQANDTLLNDTITVYNRGVNSNFLEESTAIGNFENGTARLKFNITGSNENLDFWIITTNYENLALAYSCINFNATHRNLLLWQLGRSTSFPTVMMEAYLNTTLDTLFGITSNDLVEVDHSAQACEILPEIPADQPIILPGQCNVNITVVENFNVSAFMGLWHQIATYYSTNGQGTCNRAEYTLSGSVVQVLNSQIVNLNLDTVAGNATVVSNDGSARLSVTLEVAPGVLVESPLLILATDYTSYAVAYICSDLPNNQRRVNTWIASRSRQLSPEAQNAVNEVINTYVDINSRFLIPSNQTNEGCFFFPTPAPNQPVTFRGQCEENINVVQNFNVTAYLGLWYNIESYPSLFQPGTCNNALYTLGDGVVDVFNTQVIDQRLDTVNGVAVVASTDGSAKLTVSFPILGTNLTTSTSYWVLDTDYVNYALVYSCSDVTEDERSIYSWKLSRSKSLQNESITAINRIIETIPVLDQRYYEVDDQSPEGCFHYPEPQTGVPVRFPGQCENVPLTSNFNMTQFQGRWYEIQAYPKEQQPGQCVSHDFSLSVNTFNLTTSGVDDQFAVVSNSVVSLATTDGTANMTISITANGDITQIPYLILNTDYGNYALAYSCVNDGPDFKMVYSWKLSRTPQLSPASITAINNTIEGITVLQERYYETVGQTDAACFTLPVIEPGNPIVLNGQCDPNIPVVQNFNITNYSGRWRIIESYTDSQLSGTCNDVSYSQSNDSILVYNSHVANQDLISISGSASLASNDSSGRLLVSVPAAANPIEYWILDTDYVSYSLVYNCVNIGNTQKRIVSWKLSRSGSISSEANNRMDQVIRSVQVLNNRYYQALDQSNNGCFYYPSPSSNTPIIFRGQCDANINVVQNFNVTRYLGLWYDISSYPTRFQLGTCGNAFYSLNGAVVDVYNTEVINQSLSTINGVASLASTDNSAKLTVTFPVAGTNLTTSTPYWVLSTDYDSYALVYSCVNIDSETRQVSSWKLSRSKELSINANTAINAVVNTIPVLDDRYYNQQNQTTEGCFYFPDPQPGVPVVFPGQCDNSIQAVSNFNMSAFTGTWHEIQAYPKDQQNGQCINHQYFSTSSNNMALVSSNIINQILSQSSSDVIFASPQDSSAKLNISFTSGGLDISIPFWILSTDYSAYALAYSCVNLNENFRGVYSWKLSRTKQLSISDNLAINNAIANIDILDTQYYENIDQSDDACFFLPDAIPNQPVVFGGQCNENINVVQNFNVSRYLGKWRLIQSYPQANQLGSCSQATYSLNSNGTVDVFNTEVINQELSTINGLAVLASNDNSAKLLVTFPGTTEPAPYWVLDTDYDSYALIYSCRNLVNNQRLVTSWKLSRTSALTPNATQNINQIVNSIDVLNERYYSNVAQTDQACFYFPAPNPDAPVVFRGQCDQNIAVVSNFNVTAYLGLWYDTSSYPTRFQQGTCGNAYYSLNGGVVNVFNTEVVNQGLSTINGVARLATTDNSAKLIVSFPIAGTNLTTETPYWVLATDYSSYALVYSCINIDQEYRQVTSWKLSRTKELASNASAPINNVVNTVQVLEDRYYVNTNQSDAGCFYFPEPELGVPVVFPGQCDQSMQAVANFNMTLFQGVWYEIQAYPKDQQSGQCINHDYSLNATNILDLISSNVFNQIQNNSNSRVTFTSAQDSSGKLTITLSSAGSNIIIPFWVLSTDYTDYALAYSCVNRDENSRAVYSWKLSRSKQLSSASNNAINNRILEIDVLDNRYYENIDQSDAACFYLPDMIPGQPVLFPGQCDLNIPVVQNFNAVAYSGRWRMIESYPSNFQNVNATCSDATYTLSGGVVDVINTQVINQALDVINGNATLATTDGSAKLLVNFPNAPRPSDYWVLSTDYTSYALVYSCVNLDSTQRQVTSWKLSRTSELTPNATRNINQIVNSIDVLNDRYYSNIAQTDQACFYFPTPNPDSPVVFRGQCDENITVVSNFNVTAYLGQWYDISSYPTRFQQGTCGNAYYSLNGSVVDVFNTEVVNQNLSTINGVARLATTDNSAKLIVSFPIAGTNLISDAPYWVLATDYSSYALVYSCINIDQENRQVTSWKLSRSKELALNAVAPINNVVNTVPVLDDRYYVNADQSDTGCFYFPEPQFRVPVVFPGQCDQSIQAVSNFNMTAFQGVWYEIAAYPKDQQSGQCINHDYSLTSTNALDLVSSNVFNQLQNISSSRVTFASAQDSSGKLTITLSSSNIVIPFWVLSTDYTDYALAYSCVNRDQNSRAVYSWKLSRSKQLSTAGNNVINNRISEINVLDNRYYENIDQSDAACFYLPDVSPGQPVLFPGQCDPNIPVVQNFNAVAYSGRWRMIESYASEFQAANASCSDATYTLSGGVVDVINTQVINQALDVVNGNATLATTDGSAKLLVNFPNSPGPSDYWVLSTDYNSYALVYSCRNVGSTQRRVYTWKLSRTRELSTNATTEINLVMNSIDVLNQQYYSRIEHSDSACFYYPVADGSPVVFRGQCNENIPVVTNFNATAYMNTWYDIESYPVQFQDGSCPTATYTLGSVVDVYNTQVMGQQLDTINGEAVLAGNANEAKLNVSFPIAGTSLTSSSPYWVLSTDYVNYAFVYSCSNVDEEYYRIGSWKLSRQRSLAPASITAINNVMNSIPVLRQNYYLDRGHTDEDCFYYPDNNGGPVIQNGQCDFNSLSVVNNFNASLFSGPWYEISRYPSELQEGECVSSQFEVNNQQFIMSKNIVFNERQITLTGPATLVGTGQGILNVNLTGQGVNFATTFYVLDIEYNDFALLYSCVNINSSSKQVYSWKLSRSQQGLSQSAENRITDVVNRTRDLFQGYYEITDQNTTGCFHYPEYTELPDQIELIGPCEENIRAKANFNVQDYLGKWYEIASYPQPFQFGQCPRAQYSLSNASSSVIVLNTQVIDRELDVQYATAVVASNDGSGFLEVTFVLQNGVTNVVNYYILETDYTSFSLVYSCRNLPNGNRIVSSWKLSRNTTLSPQAVPIIDSIISNTRGLNENFYKQANQSSEACFYVPEVNKNEAPRFRGQCDNIQSVQGFKAQRFLGWWHEIESYPTSEDRGTCISSEYSQVGSIFQVVDTNVFGLSARVNRSNVVISNDGRLTRIINGQSIDVWVLATDYDNYALLYSCENIDSNYRRVWSGKYSKTRELSANAQNAIAAAIQREETLEAQFFQEINQTDVACFYYPEPTENPVILPGSCDPNIPVVSNFSVVNYSGVWYQIEKYPQIHENGTCVGARYTFNENTGVVDVLNWQVIDDVLDTVSGNATFISDDGSAKLLVSLPIRFTDDPEPEMVSMELYVLATDYLSYSLAYSCVNVGPYRRSVGVWKLSRTRTLLPQGAQVIDSLIATRQELDQSYFLSVEQNDDCDEPSSAILVKSSIIIMILCSILLFL